MKLQLYMSKLLLLMLVTWSDSFKISSFRHLGQSLSLRSLSPLYCSPSPSPPSEGSPNVTDYVTQGYGVSYIGGDPCSSKYNDDPFEEQVEKPDAWVEMAKRIDEIVKRENEKERLGKEAQLKENDKQGAE